VITHLTAHYREQNPLKILRADNVHQLHQIHLNIAGTSAAFPYHRPSSLKNNWLCMIFTTALTNPVLVFHLPTIITRTTPPLFLYATAVPSTVFIQNSSHSSQERHGSDCTPPPYLLAGHPAFDLKHSVLLSCQKPPVTSRSLYKALLAVIGQCDDHSSSISTDQNLHTHSHLLTISAPP
jgi:hypothetical protein